MVCNREEEQVDAAPLEDPLCSCNGKWNDDRLGVQACESSFHGDAWCYVEPGRCSDEMTSVRTGKSWSRDACEELVSTQLFVKGMVGYLRCPVLVFCRIYMSLTT